MSSPSPGDGSAGARSGPTAAGPVAEVEAYPELDFSVVGAAVEPHSSVPTLRFDLRIDAGGASVRSLSLNVEARILAQQRRYDEAEGERLFELFGAPKDWGRNVRGLQWSRTSFVVPSFEGEVETGLSIPCSYDFDVAANKYLHAVREGEIPLEFLFSGSVFYPSPSGALRTVRLPWDRECRFDMRAALWHEMMERYFPNSAWIRLHRDVFDRLHAFRTGRGHPTWEATLEALLPEEERAPPDARGERP